MSRFFCIEGLKPYVPGEQPRQGGFIKLNTNESPYAPTPKAQTNAYFALGKQHLYCDPTAKALKEKLAENLGVSPDQLVLGNGSDEILDFAFEAFCTKERGAIFPDITYGFYPVFAKRHGVPYREMEVRSDLTIAINDYYHAGATVFLANPNAPTGMELPPEKIRRILDRNPDNVVVIDEAYVDFGGTSVLPLVKEYPNLLVVRTFSKSRSLAGARLGFGVGQPELIRDLETVRNATNPYNVTGLTQAMGLGTLDDEWLIKERIRDVIKAREFTAEAATKMGLEVLPSKANFLFLRHRRVDGAILYNRLRDMGILVRHFPIPKIRGWIRISIGSDGEMRALVRGLEAIVREFPIM